MAINSLRFHTTEILEESLDLIDINIISSILKWLYLGGRVQLMKFLKVPSKDRACIIEYLEEFHV